MLGRLDRLRGGGCSTYKRAVARGAILLPTFLRSVTRATLGEERSGRNSSSSSSSRRRRGRRRKRRRGKKRERKRGERPSHPSSYRPLILASPNDSVHVVPPSMHQRRLHRQQQQLRRPTTTRPAAARRIYTPRDDGEGEPNYQSTPPPPCTETLPRRLRRLPFLLPCRVSSEARIGP